MMSVDAVQAADLHAWLGRCHDQGLAGWSMGERQTNAFVMALSASAPDGEPIHHVVTGSAMAQPVRTRAREQCSMSNS